MVITLALHAIGRGLVGMTTRFRTPPRVNFCFCSPYKPSSQFNPAKLRMMRLWPTSMGMIWSIALLHIMGRSSLASKNCIEDISIGGSVGGRGSLQELYRVVCVHTDKNKLFLRGQQIYDLRFILDQEDGPFRLKIGY